MLARKWRPQSFADVIGQNHVLTALKNGLSLGRLHHAYLFSGTRGVGKTTIARLLAKGLNCETGITAIPCAKCDSCREIEHGCFVDLIEIDAASRTKVEDTRDLIDNVQYMPARGRFKVYLIDEVHMLSRHSFNALLKTLEEPPSYVKFLLATTDPQKLPVTILSRCLQFHLKALDVELISNQLDYILQQEHIRSEPRALQLLSRAADGSMRDALSLADQAIAMGQGVVSSSIVSQMLGNLDDDHHPVGLIKALVDGSIEKMITLLNKAASYGVEWDALLVEMLRLLHRIAMLQVLPSLMSDEEEAHTPLLLELARITHPADIQLYYQTLLMGRKDLSLAPNLRMGVEMTLLRALVFHPQTEIMEPIVPSTVNSQAAGQPDPLHVNSGVALLPPESTGPLATVQSSLPSNTTGRQLLQARTQLLRQETNVQKKNKLVACLTRPVNSTLKHLTCVTKHTQDTIVKKEEAYRWKAQTDFKATSKATRSKFWDAALKHEKNTELVECLMEEAKQRDTWTAEIAMLKLPKLVQQLALNAWKETTKQGVCLHLRSNQRHLDSAAARQALGAAMSDVSGNKVELTIIEDDNTSVLTPLEWQQAIYEEKLMRARQSIIKDTHVQTICRLFDADLDEESIRPV